VRLRRRPIRPLHDDEYELSLDAVERQLLHRLAADLRELVEAGDAGVVRLFPPAHPDDPEANAEYDRLVRDGLLAGRLDALARVDATADAKRLSRADVEAWCGVLNDLRLVLGERLGVTEDMYEEDLGRDPELALYGWLTWLQAEVVEALAARLE
jgi:hypothetical protein